MGEGDVAIQKLRLQWWRFRHATHEASAIVAMQFHPWSSMGPSTTQYSSRILQSQKWHRGFCTCRQGQPSIAWEGAPKLHWTGKHGEHAHHAIQLALEDALRSGQTITNMHSLNITCAHENACQHKQLYQVCHSPCSGKNIQVQINTHIFIQIDRQIDRQIIDIDIDIDRQLGRQIDRYNM